MDEIRVRVADGATVAASALRYDAECTREVAASIRARSQRARDRAESLREEHAAVHAESDLVRRRTIRLLAEHAPGRSAA